MVLNPSTPSNPNDSFTYNSGFGGHFQSEALKNALPVGQNTPQKCNYGLYAEQLSGSAFTVPRCSNMRSWLYRIRPSVCHGEFKRLKELQNYVSSNSCQIKPEQYSNVINIRMRWSPFEIPKEKTDFVEGLFPVCGSGDPSSRNGLSILMYCANADMKNKAFYNSDGDFLIVPQEGILTIRTEFGFLSVAPNEIAVIPRFIFKFN
jgi:homogentisate 1,2-dioxygenase